MKFSFSPTAILKLVKLELQNLGQMHICAFFWVFGWYIFKYISSSKTKQILFLETKWLLRSKNTHGLLKSRWEEELATTYFLSN